MRYQKPVVMDLSAAARGQGPLGCYNGEGPGGNQWCQSGTSPTSMPFQCNVGPNAGGIIPQDACITGNSPTVGFCMTGVGGANWGDACTTGPVPA